ncbi:hypothetical protein [Noviherbaspirillum sedimenti]|uniref:hypothetical protein n=1 Tax=Noviherbaspirillum sedimenti TaxID=2320865 RepID=UPI0011C34D0B|nr:hypothetical protein [Noviherbaspirillum sedimenti]
MPARTGNAHRQLICRNNAEKQCLSVLVAASETVFLRFNPNIFFPKGKLIFVSVPLNVLQLSVLTDPCIGFSQTSQSRIPSVFAALRLVLDILFDVSQIAPGITRSVGISLVIIGYAYPVFQ